MSLYNKTVWLLTEKPRNPRYLEVARTVQEYLRAYWQGQGYSPSIQEIRSELDMGQTTLYYWLQQMRDRGDLLFEDGIARSFRLPNQQVVFEDENRS